MMPTMPPRGRLLLGLVALLRFLRGQLLEAGEARLALGVPALRARAHPFKFGLHRLLPGGGLLFLDLQALFLLLQPGGVVAFPRDAVPAVQFEDPARDIVEEVAVMGHGHDRTGEFGQEAFQPGNAFRIEVVGGFVQQQHVGIGQQQLAQCHAATFAAGQCGYIGVPGRQAQGIGGDLQLALEVVSVGGLQDVFQPRLLGSERVVIGIGLRVSGIHGIELLLRVRDFRK